MLDLETIRKMPKKPLKRMRFLAKVSLARKSFWHYCRLRYPDLYTPDKAYLHDYCNKLQAFIEDKLINPKTNRPYTILMVNMPPRFAKSLTVGRLQEWCFGRDPSSQFITTCYNNVLSTTFSRSVRDAVDANKSNEERQLNPIDIFPKIGVKKGNASVTEWTVNDERAYSSFFATSFSATITGKGCKTAFIVDDQINQASDAMNEEKLAQDWFWFCNTAYSRTEQVKGVECKFIIIMTRWTNRDICGRILEDEMLRDETCVVKYEAMDLKTGNMLCPSVLSRHKYNIQKKLMSPEIFMANYHQKPIDNEGREFKVLKQYKTSDCNFSFSDPKADVRIVLDPTDGKHDYICGICYLVYQSQAYIMDIYHTRKAEDITPKKVAQWIAGFGNVKEFNAETNKNERFVLDIVDFLRNDYNQNPRFNPKYETINKQIRIESASWWIQQNIFFPEKWMITWKDFYDHIYGYQRGGKNKYDDAPDTLAKIKENVYNVGTSKVIVGSGIKFKNNDFGGLHGY